MSIQPKTITLSLEREEDVWRELEGYNSYFHDDPPGYVIISLLRSWARARKTAREQPQLVGL